MKTKNKRTHDAYVLYTLLGTQAISLIGTKMTTIALGIWLYQRTGRTMDLLFIPLFNELPSLLFGSALGTVIDRYNRKILLILADFGQAIGTLFLFFSIITGQFQTYHLYGVVFLQGFFTAVQEPCADATTALLTTPVNRSRVNAIKELTFPAAGMIAPLLAGILYVAIGINGIILIDLNTFLIATAIISRLALPNPIGTEAGSPYSGGFYSRLRGGYAFIFRNRGLFYWIVYMSLLNLLINGPIELVMPYLLEKTGSEVFMASMLSLMSVSTTISAFSFSIFKIKVNKTKLTASGMFLTGAGMVFLGIAKSRPMYAAALFLLMFPLPLLNITFKTILQEKTPQDLQGRVFSSAYQTAYGVAPLSFFITGTLADQIAKPYVNMGKSELISHIIGNKSGSGMGLILVVSGLFIVGITLIFLRNDDFKMIENRMKSYN